MKIPIINIDFNELFKFKDSSRSDKAKKNIIILFVLHVFNFVSIMALVPVTLNYLGKEDYGIWLTLASILSWLINLDFGIGNGLRNKLAEALALNDFKLARIYISTAYTIFGIGIFCAIIIYFFVHGFLNWAFILNAPNEYFNLLNTLAFYVIILFMLQFFLKLLTSVINADQRPALNGALSLIVNSLTLLAVFILSKVAHQSLMLFGIVSSLVPVFIFVVASLFLFNGHYKSISPSFKFVNFKYSSNLVKLGIQFFIIQISSLIIFTTDNIIITQLFGPKPVVIYNIAYKYFYLVPMVFNVVLAPFWSAFTEAYIKNEFDWIKNSVNKLKYIWALLSVITIGMILLSNFIYKIWVGKEIQVPIILSIFTGLFVIIANWNNIYAYFLNGIGKVKIQLYYSVFVAIINIPLSVLLAKNFGMGITGVIVATDICLIIASVWAPIQYKKLITGTAKGLWNR